MKRVGIWLRVSTEDQVRGESPEHHEARARAYAESKKWSVIEVYRLDAFSGKSVKHHSETKRMLADVRRGHITGLLFSKLARFARNTAELIEFAEFFRSHDADLVSLYEAIDTSTAAGRLFYTMNAAMGQWEREETAERVAASVPVRARMGKPLGGVAAFGYQWLDGVLCPEPQEAPIRKLIYELYREHKRKRTVARILNQRGYRTRKGNKFSDATVGRLITDTTAKGVRTANRVKSNGPGLGWHLKEEKDWIEVPIEAIVSTELWEECNTILAESGNKIKKHRGRTPKYLFAGYLLCGSCTTRSKMYRQTGWNKYRCYKCATKIAEDDMEAIFLEQISGFLLSEDRVETMLEESRNAAIERQNMAGSLRKDRAALMEKSDTLIDLYQQGGFDVDEFKNRNQPIKERMKEIERELAQIEEEGRSITANMNAKKEALRDGARLKDEWPTMDFDQKRKVVESLVDRITISGEGIELNLNYIPGANGSGKHAILEDPIVKSDRTSRGSSRRRA